MEQMYFLPSDSQEPVTLDIRENLEMPNGLCFEDKDWQKYLPSLKPFGLNLLLNTNCDGRKRVDPHRNHVPLLGHVKTGRQGKFTLLFRQ
jgi:hypothetical protein